MTDSSRHPSYVFLNKGIGMALIGLLALWLIISGWAVSFLLSSRAFDGVDAYVKTDECADEAFKDASAAVDQYAQFRSRPNLDSMYGPKITNLSIAIYSLPDNELVYRNFEIERKTFENTLWHYTDGFTDTVGGNYYSYSKEGKNALIEADYRVEYALPEVMAVEDGYFYGTRLYNAIYSRRYLFSISMIAAAIAFVFNCVFLACGAGHKEGTDEIVLSAFDRIPLDFLFVFFGLLLWLMFLVTDELTVIPTSMIISGNAQQIGYSISNLIRSLLSWMAFAFPAGYIILSLILTTCARTKAGTLFTNTIIYRVILFVIEVIEWLPEIPKTAGALVLVWLILYFLAIRRAYLAAFFFALAVSIAVLWTAWQQKRLRKMANLLAQGDLDTQISEAGLAGDYRRHAEDLQNIRNVVNIAVEKEMRSAHLQTDLITNVSHDIKTPLTSIINYVDLLKRAETQEERDSYLDALSRNSSRLKRLTEDLVEASKASTGSIPVEPVCINVREMVTQAVAEYKEKLDEADLKPVVNIPDANLCVTADGRLLWRVLSNLFSNCVKYALPGTRVYIDAQEADEETVCITVKNTSRDELNVSPDELMERFVRGDRSRNTEGSGLGLDIARSLTTLQNGTLKLDIDADLFKAAVTLPKAEKPV